MNVHRRCFLRLAGMLCSAGLLWGCRRDEPEEMFPPRDEEAVLTGRRLRLARADRPWRPGGSHGRVRVP